MTPARALITRLTSAGVTLRLDGDAIMHRGPRSVLSPDVLNTLRKLKGEIVVELRHHAEFGPPSLPDIACGNGSGRDGADPGAVSPGSWHIKADGLRRRIVAALDQLPAPRDHNGRRLIAETRRFLGSQWWTKALECEWAIEELFGVDRSSPTDCVERWGLVPGLAWAPRRGDAIELIDAEHAVIRFFAGAPLKNAWRIERRFTPTESAVPWWECAGLMGDVEQLTV